MIEIICSDELYTYNVYHITKAFFPSEKVEQSVERTCADAVRVTLPDGTVLLAERAADRCADRQERKRCVDREIYTGLHGRSRAERRRCLSSSTMKTDTASM